MHIVDMIVRALIASIGWYAAFVAGRMQQAEETWILGRSFKLMKWFLAVASAAVSIIMAMI